jgi:hypothetical protein
MRIVVIVCIAIILYGCMGRWKAGPQAAGREGPDGASASAGSNSYTQRLIVTPENALVGKVAFVNTTARFVVLNFPIGHLPAIEQRLNLYRGGLKVGEVKVTGPQYDDNVVADLLAGDSEIGDQVRDR